MNARPKDVYCRLLPLQSATLGSTYQKNAYLTVPYIEGRIPLWNVLLCFQILPPSALFSFAYKGCKKELKAQRHEQKQWEGCMEKFRRGYLAKMKPYMSMVWILADLSMRWVISRSENPEKGDKQERRKTYVPSNYNISLKQIPLPNKNSRCDLHIVTQHIKGMGQM